MRTIAEKHDLLNTKRSSSGHKQGSGDFPISKNRLFVQIIGKMAVRMKFLDSETDFFGRIVDILRSKMCFLNA